MALIFGAPVMEPPGKVAFMQSIWPLFSWRRPLTVEVPSAGEGVRAVGVVLEVDPDDSKRGAYPEFAGT